MSDEGRCTGCGAKMTPTDGACPYCGASAAAPAAVAAPPDPAAGRAAALAAVRAHPSYDALTRKVPPVPVMLKALSVVPIVVGSVFVAVAAAIALGLIAADIVEFPKYWVVIAGFLSVFALIGVAAIVTGVRTRRNVFGGPPRAGPAVVLAKRTEPGQNATAYYVTLALEGGGRVEFGTLNDVFRSAFEGDAGVAHTRGELLLAFRRVPS